MGIFKKKNKELIFISREQRVNINMMDWVFIIASQSAKNKKSKVQLDSLVSPLLCSCVILLWHIDKRVCVSNPCDTIVGRPNKVDVKKDAHTQTNSGSS